MTEELLTVRYESWKKPLACSYEHTFSMHTCSRVEPAALRFCRWMREFACCLSRNTERRERVRFVFYNGMEYTGEGLARHIQHPSKHTGFRLLAAKKINK